MKTVKYVLNIRDELIMNIDFLAIFKWIAWGLISVVFYHFFLKEFIQFEVVIDNRVGGAGSGGAVTLLKGEF